MVKCFIKNISKSELQSVIDQSKSLKDVLFKLGFYQGGYGYTSLKKRIKELNINLDLFLLNKFNFLKTNLSNSLEDVLVENSKYSRATLKKRLFKEGLLKEECSSCGLGTEWNGKPIVLQLDHINGVNNDNRLENLRILCPNCHSQTPTHSGKNAKDKKIDSILKLPDGLIKSHFLNCNVCNISVTSGSQGLCSNCYHLKQRKVTNRPSKEELEKMLWEIPTTHIGLKYGVSDKAVEKWCKSYGISKPPRGYWTKLKI